MSFREVAVVCSGLPTVIACNYDFWLKTARVVYLCLIERFDLLAYIIEVLNWQSWIRWKAHTILVSIYCPWEIAVFKRPRVFGVLFQVSKSGLAMERVEKSAGLNIVRLHVLDQFWSALGVNGGAKRDLSGLRCHIYEAHLRQIV